MNLETELEKFKKKKDQLKIELRELQENLLQNSFSYIPELNSFSITTTGWIYSINKKNCFLNIPEELDEIHNSLYKLLQCLDDNMFYKSHYRRA